MIRADVENWRAALTAFRIELTKAYGPRLKDLILYGSRARGDAEIGSDVDTLVVLDALGSFWEEFARVGAAADRVSLENDVVISAIPVSAEEFRSRRSPLLLNVRREGVRVA
jgi:predicted nucleotidyltransferase